MHTGEDDSETNTNSLEVNDELKYLAGAHAIHTVEDEGGINTNSLKVNDELAYLAGAHAIHSFYTKGVISSAINSIIPPKLHS